MNLEEAQQLAQRASLPAHCGNFEFGTAGWTDPSLIRCKRFYPPKVNTAAARLSYYASQFKMVEVDASYYTLLDPALASRWLELTPPSFGFHVKAHASLTGHAVELGRLPKYLKEGMAPALLEKGRAYPKELSTELLERMRVAFEAFLAPLQLANRLRGVLMQFPPWFHATRGHAREIEVVRERFPSLPIHVEFRHASWLSEVRRERVAAWLTKLGLTYVIVDEPVDARVGGVPPTCLVTTEARAVVRFHGQNTAGWRTGATITERFDYLYSEAELQRWVEPMRQVAEQVERVDVVFNNCVQDYAPLNAKALSWLLQSRNSAQASSDAGPV